MLSGIRVYHHNGELIHRYQFNYFDQLHTYLAEIEMYNSADESINSTIFKYNGLEENYATYDGSVKALSYRAYGKSSEVNDYNSYYGQLTGLPTYVDKLEVIGDYDNNNTDDILLYPLKYSVDAPDTIDKYITSDDYEIFSMTSEGQFSKIGGGLLNGYKIADRAPLDANGDGRSDLLFYKTQVLNGDRYLADLQLRITGQDGRSSSTHTLFSGLAKVDTSVMVAPGDYDGNGLMDVALLLTEHKLSIYFSDLDAGGFSFEKQDFYFDVNTELGNFFNPELFLAMDLNGDAVSEIVMYNSASSHYGGGSRTVKFLNRTTLESDPGAPGSYDEKYFGDFTGNGIPEVFSHFRANVLDQWTLQEYVPNTFCLASCDGKEPDFNNVDLTQFAKYEVSSGGIPYYNYMFSALDPDLWLDMDKEERKAFREIIVGDFNGDGFDDISALANWNGHEGGLHLSNGTKFIHNRKFDL